MNRAGRVLLSMIMLLLLVTGVGGCAESSWVIPYPPGEKPSKLWTEDPRTRGWGGVVVYYNLYGDGSIEAKVRSTDGRHGFNAWGDFWNETKNGERSAQYMGENVTPVTAVRFGEREERYLDGGVSSVEGRSLIPFEPARPN
jgi:hypothetical protein